MPLTISLTALHAVIQAAMPFDDYHLFDFRIGQQRYAPPDPDWPDPKTGDIDGVELAAVLKPGVDQFTYTYDFGDNWCHTVTVEEIAAVDPTVTYPRLINGARRAPPEDVGGTIAFEEFLAIIGKPRHPERKAMLTWCGGSFDSEAIPIDLITERMSALVTQIDSL